MKKAQLSSWLLSTNILFLFSTINNTFSVNGQCLNHQRSNLLNFKNSLTFELRNSTKLVQWNPEEDCCTWSGVGCDASGRVTTLDLEYEGIYGAADNLSTLFRLQFLENLNLRGNNFNIPIPKAIGNLTSLVSLDLGYSDFVGQIPIELSSLTSLVSLDLSGLKVENPNLKMLIQNLSNIENITLDGVDLSSLGTEWSQVIAASLPKLTTLSLRDCSLVGQFPEKILEVPTLQSLDISYNKLLQGSLPQFPKISSLRNLVLSYCNFSGTISSAHIEGLKSLRTLDLANNSFSGVLPSSLFELPALIRIDPSKNQFSGQIDEIHSGLSMSSIQVVDLSFNHLNGSFPKFLFELKGLRVLTVYNNSFNGTVQLEAFKNLSNFTYLDLSRNKLTVEIQNYNVSLAKIELLSLSYCKLRRFPKIKNNTGLYYVDLSNNKITGEIPNWLWNQPSLSYLNLSINSFVGLQQPYDISTVGMLDLHSNKLKGKIPYLSSPPYYVDFSKNSLTGSIPDSICNTYGVYLDMSKNSLIGTIPSCLVANDQLEVLNLAGNNLSGSIPDTFPANCSLITLELGMNKLQGNLPRTLSNCNVLEVLNLGYNKIEDVFPCMFENSSTLRVVSLRSNNFHGELECFGYNYSWPQLQIIDIASNNFSGVLSSSFFSSLETMITLSKGDYLRYRITILENYYYQFKLGVTLKGFERELEKIFTIFTAIDFSNNKLSGNIPESIGDLKLLYVLDLSGNKITGTIPFSIGKLSNLGSLDLSRNQLIGEIPLSLQDLTFLTYLNLSFNMLTGKIPIGSQLQTFSNDSYIGNVELCGFPLNVRCGEANYDGSSSRPSSSNKNEINWMYICASLGYIVGLWIFSMFLLFCARWRKKLFLQIDHLLVKVFSPQGINKETIIKSDSDSYTESC